MSKLVNLSAIVAVGFLSACSSSSSDETPGGQGGSAGAGGAGGATGAHATLPTLTDWDCPDGWTTEPGFADANGAADIPTGMKQFNVCKYPAAWDGAAGPAKLKNWTCPTGWSATQHPTILAEDGTPFTWCTPPKMALVFSAKENADSSDYTTPIPSGANASDYQKCDVADAMMPKLWETGCVHIGDACPTGDFPDIPSSVSGNRIYVKAGSTGGTGALATPFATIGEAVTASAAGDVIVVAQGSYDEVLAPDKALTIWGACVEHVAIADTTSAVTGAALTVSNSLTLKNVSVSSTGMGINVNGATASLKADGVLLRRATKVAVNVASGEATINGSLILNPITSSKNARGLLLLTAGTATATATVTNSVFEDCSAAVYANSAKSTVTLTDVLVRGTRADESWGGMGIGADKKSTLTATRVVTEETQGDGFYLVDVTATLTDVAATNTRGNPANCSYGPGRGLGLISQGTLTLQRGLFSGNAEGGLYVFQSGTTGTLDDVVVIDSLPNEKTKTGGYAIAVDLGASAQVNRALVQRSRGGALFVQGAETEFTASDIIVADTLEQASDSNFGAGVTAVKGGAATFERALFDNNKAIGVSATGSASKMTLTDVVVRNTAPQVSDKNGGLGVQVDTGAVLKADRLVVQKSNGGGVLAAIKAEATLTDVVVQDTKSRESDGLFGYGISQERFSTMTITRARVERCKEAGLRAWETDDGTVTGKVDLTAQDVVIRDITGHSSDGDVGTGVALMSRINASLARVLVDRTVYSAFYVDGKATAQATDLVARHTTSSTLTTSPGYYGWGASIMDSTLSGSRLLFDTQQDSGMVFLNAATSTLTDVTVRGTTAGACALLPSTDPHTCLGAGETATTRGIALVGPAAVTIDKFDIVSNGTMGAQLMIGVNTDGTAFTSGGVLTLTNGTIGSQDIGVNIQGMESYDQSTLTTNVDMSGNKKAIGDATLPRPLYILTPAQ